MTTLLEFEKILKSEFPDDRLTYQKSVPTFHPQDANEAAACVRLAIRYKQKIFITGFGNNIDPLREPFVSMLSIRTDRLNDVIDVSPGDFYITVGSGFPLRELNVKLKRHKLFLPHALLPYVGSVGGAVATNLSGRMNMHPLPIKKYLIKAEIVTPEGEIVTPGSVCFKSVSGYDIVKIFAPSWGLLGLVVSATFRVMPDSAIEEFADIKMSAIERERFLSGLDETNQSTDAQYCRKIRQKFDPHEVFPTV